MPTSAAAAGALATSEASLHWCIERSQDIVYRFRLVPEAAIDYISPAVTALTGYAPDDFYADPHLWRRLIHPHDRHLMDVPGDGADRPLPIVHRWIRRDGSIMWAEDRRIPVLDADGRLVAVEGLARDITDRVEAEQRLLSSQARFHDLLSDVDLATLMVDTDGRVVFANDHLLGILGRTREEVLGREWVDANTPERTREELRQAIATAIAEERGAGRREDLVLTASGEERLLAWTSVIQRDAAGVVVGLAAIAHDVTDAHRVARERALLASAVEHTADSVMITDLDATITYVNPAFERLSGYTAAEVIGRKPTILRNPPRTAAEHAAMWAAHRRGTAWAGELTNRRKDGSLYRVDAVISPMRAPDGSIMGYVSSGRDVSRERELEWRTEVLTRERLAIADTIRTLPPGGSLEERAELICRRVQGLTDVVMAAIVAFDSLGSAMPFAYVAADDAMVGLRQLPAERSRYLREHAEAGPWVERWTGDRAHPYAASIRAVGARAFAYVPVSYDGALMGILLVGSARHDAVEQLSGQLGALMDFGGLAGAMLGQAIREWRDQGRQRSAIEEVIASRAFTPVFQPIVDLRTGVIVGHEALTRFTHGTAPHRRFAQAADAGLGIDLECATLESALAAASALPRRWLHLNVTPELVLAPGRLRRLLQGARSRIVLEVTEHAAITDYLEFREAIASIGLPVQLAVDDAGAGFASLRHILELRPTFVKLDLSLVRGIDAHPAKQALVAGMRHFTRSTGRHLIAEGVETAAEAATLRGLDIRLAQGYLLGGAAPLTPPIGARRPVDDSRPMRRQG